MEYEYFYQTYNVSRETFSKLEVYVALLEKWQRKINLVSPQTLANAGTRHIEDSVQMSLHLHDKNANIADIGSGAGFPGLVLAVMGYPFITLIESDMRKCMFLKEVARQTDTPCTILNTRIENVDTTYDVITARALADVDQLLTLTRNMRRRETKLLFLKGLLD